MILYSKSGEFLGIGKEELSFLGYEDLDEFKIINDDVADLFVNRPGYIFKFKNFSWIDYALHSGAPKKSVIIKLKTGNEVETAIRIKELFLNNPKENEDIYYCVEFTNSINQINSLESEKPIETNPSSSFNSLENTTETTKIVTPSYESDFEKSIEDEIEENKEEQISSDFNITDNIEEESSFKLKIDSYEEEFNKKPDLKEDLSQDYVEEELQIGLKPSSEENFVSVETSIDVPKEIPEELEISLKEDYEDLDISLKDVSKEDLDISLKDISKEDTVEFDLLNCVEELGLDIALVSELITEYLSKLDETLPQIHSAINEENQEVLKQNIYNLKGISDNLYMKNISNQLTNILNAKNTDDKNNELEKFEQIVTKFKGEFI